MSETCDRLRVFISAYLPRLGQSLDKAGVEVEFFAQTWLITLLFHFQVDQVLSLRRQKSIQITNQRVIESLILDLLCLDGPKSLLKVPLCAL